MSRNIKIVFNVKKNQHEVLAFCEDCNKWFDTLTSLKCPICGKEVKGDHDEQMEK